MDTKIIHYLVLVVFAASLIYVWLGGWRVGAAGWLVFSVSRLASIFSAAIIFLDRKK